MSTGPDADLTRETACTLRDLIASGEVGPVEVLDAHLDAIERRNPGLNAIVTLATEAAREAAQSAEAMVQAGKPLGPLHGLPVVIKDVTPTAGIRTTYGCTVYADHIPGEDATVVAQLRTAGAIILGKSNTPEFAAGANTDNEVFGATRNPWNTDRSPAGSSGGSAAAVSSGMVPLAHGTDFGGSLRVPAAFCGIVGMKPTYGRCSRWGVIAFASSLDQAGPLTRTVEDSALMLQAMASFDPKDSTSVDMPVPDFAAALTGDIRGLRVGVPAEYRMEGTPPEIEVLWQQGIDWLRDAGAEIVDISLPHTKYALPAYYIVAPAEASSNLARYDGVRYGLRVEGEDLTDTYERTRAEGFGAEVQRRVMIGTYVLSAGYYDAYYLKAQRVRTRIADDFRAAWDGCDVILTPTTPSAAFAIGEKMDDPIAMYLNDIFTVPASMAGLPAISVPAGLSAEGLPLGLHLIAPAFGEETLFRAAGVLEAAAAFDARP